ncbi:hypothetical protein C8R46DRAFT_1225271 [Mycena filopes]|nr:hypothetical protein C8R46DRAFT_1225271 [Mycena filopes]
MSSPDAKRQRTEDAPITRSELWHADGSVVLQAENTQFRVHWGVLGRNSSFFRDMQSLPQPPDQPTVEGCPVVELPDNVTDVEFVLKALYTPPFLCQTALPLPVIAAHIRLGTKYDFRGLLDLALERLTYENPTTLEEYDARKLSDTRRIVFYDGIEFDVITLARENNILSVLPCAFYRLAIRAHTDPVENLFEGVEKADGARASISLHDLRVCMSGREKLMRAQMQTQGALGWYRFWGPGADCTNTNSAHCAKTRDVRLRDYLNYPFLKALADFDWHDKKNKRLCDACKRGIQEAISIGRGKTWDDLPGFFNLPPWNELKNEL